MNGTQLLEKLVDLMEKANEKREGIESDGFESNLRLVIDGKKYVINAMWGVNGSTSEEVAESYKTNSKKILDLAVEVKSKVMAASEVSKDFGVKVEHPLDGYYTDLISAHRILTLNFKIESLKIDIQSTKDQLISEGEKRAALMSDILKRNQIDAE